MAKPIVWPVATMLLGIGLFASLPSIGVEMMDQYVPVTQGALMAGIAVGAALIGAAIARRSAWIFSGVATLAGTVVGMVVLSTQVVAVAAPWGDEMLPRGSEGQVPESFRLSAEMQKADLLLLEKGTRAARNGSPLLAPEGGYLVPTRLSAETTRAYSSPLRYTSAQNSDVAPVWSTMLVWQHKAYTETQKWATVPTADSSGAWVRRGLSTSVIGLVLAIGANLLALLSRTLFGAPR